MKIQVASIYLFFATLTRAQNEGEVTMNINDRIRYLKFQLLEQLKTKMKHDKHANKYHHLLPDNEEPKLLNYNYDYVDLSQVPVTPISENDERKRDEKYKLRQLKTTTTTTTTTTTKRTTTTRTTTLPPPTTTIAPPPPFNPISDTVLEETLKKKKHEKKSKKMKMLREPAEVAPASASIAPVATVNTVKPVEIFYRRLITEELRNVPLQWTHCEDLITPYLTGIKKELMRPKFFGPQHRTVMRLVHLLSLNATVYSKEDIYSLMYQISNIQIRLFQWEVPAVKILFNAVAKGQRHTFKVIKRAMQNIFAAWHMDLSNTTNLLHQSRLFRPLCINDISMDGSTKSSRVFKYTGTSDRTTKDCGGGGYNDDDDRRKKMN